jgi:hypothetical protein
MIKCAYKPCKNKFEPRTHNQKYCSDECCKIATNLNIKKKYQDRKQRLAGKKRYCKNRGCEFELTMYNAGDICGSCLSKERENERQEVLRILNGFSI